VTTYALADTQVQWFADDFPGIRFEPNCGVLHTTETTGWPGYEGGATAPNYTARPDFNAKRLRWRAHFHDEMSSRALRNLAGGVETNTLNAVQVELVGTCDSAKRDLWVKAGMKRDRDFLFWPEAPEWALRDLAVFVVDMHKRHHILIQGPDVWMAYPASFGISNPNRFTFSQWRAFFGWCGHQHVPENAHGDPGALPWAKVVEYALELLGPEPPAWNRPRWPRPQTREVVAYHNVFGGLDDDKARLALHLVLVTRPDIVGLGEWAPNRRRFLAEHDDYMWIKPGSSYPPVGARKDRYRCFTAHGVTLAKGRPVEKKPGKPSRGFLPDNHATVVVWEEIETGHMVTTVCFHLPSFIEAGGVWRRVAGVLTKRARMAREAKRKLRKIAKAHWARGRRVYLLGDSNFDEMRLSPLTSCWKGRKPRATHGRRTIDVVYAQQPAKHTITLATPSDHKAVVAYYPEES